MDRLNHVVEKENEAHDYFGKGLADWQKSVTGNDPSGDATNLKKQFDDYEQSMLSTVPKGGKRHTALAESLPMIKDSFLKQGHQFAVNKLNERSRTVLDKGLQRIAKGALGAKDEKGVQAHDDAAFDLINKYVLSEARFDEKDADAMYDKYLGYAGGEQQPAEEAIPEQSVVPENQRKPVKAEKDDMPSKETPTNESSAQHAREMEKKVEKENESGKLAGIDNDTHHNKQAGADKAYESKKWTPEESVDFMRGYVGSKAYSKEAEIDQFKKGTNKCNKFVSDVLEKTGAVVPQIGGILGGDPPSADNWENTNLEIEGYEIVDVPKPGDVAAVDGHVGIVTEDGKTISASSEANKVVENDWGFREDQKGRVTFRRYVEKRK